MKYTIVHVNDRCRDQIISNKKMLFSFEYVDDIEFVNGNTVDAKAIIHKHGISTATWRPYDGRSSDPLPGEFGVWCSLINVWDKIIESNMESLLVLEDDSILSDGADSYLSLIMNELPDEWDFLSLFYFEDQNDFDKSTDIGKNYIHKSTNQLSGGVAFVFSNAGAKKIKKILKRVGLEYTSDCFIFHHAILGSLNGYSLKKSSQKFVGHSFSKTGSVIDPNNLRNVDL